MLLSVIDRVVALPSCPARIARLAVAFGAIASVASAWLCHNAEAVVPGPAARRTHAAPPRPALERLPPGSTMVPLENIEGVVLVPATLKGGGRDTTGPLVIDTGAGFLALDGPLANLLGIEGVRPGTSGVMLSGGFLPRLELGTMQLDHVAPILTLDVNVIRRATGRDVLGLAGQHVFAGRALWIDYEGGRAAFVPSVSADPTEQPAAGSNGDSSIPGDATTAPAVKLRVLRARRSRRLLAPLLSASARAIPFRLAGDHKMLVRARFRDSATAAAGGWLTLVFDTGATKCALFEPALTEDHPTSRRWRSVTGLVAPTLVGSPSARVTLAPALELETTEPARPLRRTDVDCVAITSDLSSGLSAAVGEHVSGLLGYSFFKRYRVAIDYPNLTLWLDPYARVHELHPFEYSHVGLQLERDGESIRVVGVAARSPADSVGIATGDTLVAIGGREARPTDLVELTDLLEGAPGTRVELTLRRDGRQRTYRLVRRRLL